MVFALYHIIPWIPYPPFRCDTIFYNIKKYNFLFYFYHSLWSQALHLLDNGPNPANLFLRLDVGWAMFCMGLIYSLSLLPLVIMFERAYSLVKKEKRKKKKERAYFIMYSPFRERISFHCILQFPSIFS